MNLVSYEYVACQSDNAGVLVLSEFAGGRWLEVWEYTHGWCALAVVGEAFPHPVRVCKGGEEGELAVLGGISAI